MIFDLHVHTAASPCSTLTLDQILAHAKSIGLDGVCITDHHRSHFAHTLDKDLHHDGLTVIRGTEYATPQGDLLLFGSDLSFPRGLSASQVISIIESQGGAVILAHPFREKRPGSEELVAQGLVSVVEEVNGRNTDQENSMVAPWLAKYPLQTVGGSDAHSLDELGRVTTYFSRPIKGWQDLASALKAGDMVPQASINHPQVVNNQLNSHAQVG